MARLQILQLPEGAGDERPPYALVVDEVSPQRYIIGIDATWRDHWHDAAETIGARGVIVTPDTIDIPANELTLAEPMELVGDVERMDQVTNALGLDRLRDWDEIVRAARIVRDGGHLFDEPGFLDPRRCARCGIGYARVHVNQDRRTCAQVQAEAGEG